MPEHAHNLIPDHRLSVKEVLDMLVADGMVEKVNAEALIAESRLQRKNMHPLVVVAEKKWKSQLNQLCHRQTVCLTRNTKPLRRSMDQL